MHHYKIQYTNTYNTLILHGCMAHEYLFWYSGYNYKIKVIYYVNS